MRLSGYLLFGVAFVAITGTAVAGTNDVRPLESPSSVHLIGAAAGQDSVAEGAKKFVDSLGARGINFLGNQSM